MKLDWQATDIGGSLAYCADGDGIVAIENADGKFILYEQFEIIAEYKTLGEAIAMAERIIEEDYPSIWIENQLSGLPYRVEGRNFATLAEASAYANWIAKVSGLIVAVEGGEQ